MKRRQKRSSSKSLNPRPRQQQHPRSDARELWQSLVKCVCVPFTYLREKFQNINIRPVSANFTRPQRNARSGAYTVTEIPEPEVEDILLLRSQPLKSVKYKDAIFTDLTPEVPEDTKPHLTTTKSEDVNFSNFTPVIPDNANRVIHLVSTVQNCYILVVGLAGAGKTATISNLLNYELTPPPEGTSISFAEIRQESPTVTLNLIEVPGFGRGQSAQEDAEIILALQKRTNALYPNRIPSIVFIVARFDDNRFEGENSEFSKMLRALRHSKQNWTDAKHSNVILLLTNAAKVKNESEDIDFKISRFQNIFYEFFPKQGFPVPVALIENVNDSKSQSRIFDSISLLRQDQILSSFIQSVKCQQLENAGHTIYTPASSLLPLNQGEIYKMMDLIQQNNPTPPEFENGDMEYQPWFVPTFKDRLSFPHSRKFGLEFISALVEGTKIVLFDKTEILVQDLVIGHRLLNKDMDSSVVISIRKLKPSDESFQRQTLGKIYCRQRNGLGDDDLGSIEKEIQIVYKYFNRKIRLGTLDVKNVDSVTDQAFYMLELDKHDSTFIADNHVLFFKQSHALQSSSHTSL